MKKQLLIAAVAAAMTTSAMADISITGNGKFEYFNKDVNDVSTNSTNTEINLGIKGKSGDTTVVLDLEFNTHGDDRIDVEDMYITTKVGQASIKAGNYTTSTSAILGEIDNGARATNKVTVSTIYNGVKIYAGNTGTATANTANNVDNTGTNLNNNMFLGVSANVSGVTVQAKRNTADISSLSIAGGMSGFDARLEMKLDDTIYYSDTAKTVKITESADVIFGNITKKVGGVSLGLAWIDADRDGLIKENDSAIFAVENGNVTANVNGDGSTDNNSKLVANKVQGNSNMQLSIKKDMSGNIVTVKAGKIGYDKEVTNEIAELDYTQLAVSRALASGTTLVLSYTNENATKEIKTFEADISVKF
jgi:hypothetical protein